MSLINQVELTKKTLKVQDIVSHPQNSQYAGAGWTCSRGFDRAQRRKALWLCGHFSCVAAKNRLLPGFDLPVECHGEKNYFLPQYQWKTSLWSCSLDGEVYQCLVMITTFEIPFNHPISDQSLLKRDAVSVVSQQDFDLYHKNRLHLFMHQGQVVTFNWVTKKKYFTRVDDAVHNFGWKEKPMVHQRDQRNHQWKLTLFTGNKVFKYCRK